MTFDKQSKTGFSLVEVIVALAILTTSTAVTVPIIARNRWQVDVDRYATQLESGLYSLRAKLGSRKTSCSMTFPSEFNFLEPAKITEFSQGTNSTSFNCCDSEISSLINDQDCAVGHPGHQLAFLICHQRAVAAGTPTDCVPGQKRLSIRCVQIDGTGAVERGRWIQPNGSSDISKGMCQAT
jgi:prepilin-type N-terminal cleavage/methylation domain-containing protein